MAIKFAEFNIAEIYTVNATKPGESKPIFCKFKDVDPKRDIMKSKGLLKKTQIYVKEHLTATHDAIFYQSRKATKSGLMKNTWSIDGHIYGAHRIDRPGTKLNNLDLLKQANINYEARLRDDGLNEQEANMDNLDYTGNLEQNRPTLETMNRGQNDRMKAQPFNNWPTDRGQGDNRNRPQQMTTQPKGQVTGGGNEATRTNGDQMKKRQEQCPRMQMLQHQRQYPQYDRQSNYEIGRHNMGQGEGQKTSMPKFTHNPLLGQTVPAPRNVTKLSNNMNKQFPPLGHYDKDKSVYRRPAKPELERMQNGRPRVGHHDNSYSDTHR